jgi:hypothetical protein
MNAHVASDLVVAYSQCHRKAFLLLQGKVKGIPHEYECILDECTAANRSRYISTLPNGQVDPYFLKHSSVRLPHKHSPFCAISADDLVANCDAILKPSRESPG